MFQQATPSHPTTPNRKLSTVHGRPRDPHWRVRGRPGESRGVLGGSRGVQGLVQQSLHSKFYIFEFWASFWAPGPRPGPGPRSPDRCKGQARVRLQRPGTGTAPPDAESFFKVVVGTMARGPKHQQEAVFSRGAGARGPARGTRGPGSGPPNISRKRYFALRGHPIDAPGLGARAPNNPGPTRSTRPGGGGGGSCRGVPRDDDIARRHIYMFIKTARPIQETN